jgi:hypothetical protein
MRSLPAPTNVSILSIAFAKKTTRLSTVFYHLKTGNTERGFVESEI